MPEAKNIVFNYKEVAEALLGKTDINEGLWGLYVEFGIRGANIGTGPEPGDDVRPAAIVPVMKIGIQKFEKPSNLTVDASKVNPKSKARKKAKKK